MLTADLLLLPWHHYALNLDKEKLGIEVPSFSLDRTGVQDPYALLGIVALVISAVMVVHTVVAKLVPAVPRPGQIHMVAGALVIGLIVAKLLSDNRFLGMGAWIGTALAVALAYGDFMVSQEASAGSGRAVGTS